MSEKNNPDPVEDDEEDLENVVPPEVEEAEDDGTVQEPNEDPGDEEEN